MRTTTWTLRRCARLARGACAALAAAGLAGCVMSIDIEDTGNLWGGWNERERDLDVALTKIDFQASGTLYVVQGERPRLRMRGSGPALNNVSVDSLGATLRIAESSPQFIGVEFSPGIREMAFYLEMPYVEDIRHGGHGEMKIGPLTSERLSVVVEDHADTKFSSVNVREFVLNAQDHADINIETLDADDVSLAASSHGDIYGHDVNTLELAIHADDQAQVWLAGRSDEARIDVADHASLDASRLECDVVDVRAGDQAVARLWAEESLSIVSRDHSDVTWSGDAEVHTREAVSER